MFGRKHETIIDCSIFLITKLYKITSIALIFCSACKLNILKTENVLIGNLKKDIFQFAWFYFKSNEENLNFVLILGLNFMLK